MADEVEIRIEGRPYLGADEWLKAQAAPEGELPPVDVVKFEKSISYRMGFKPISEARREYAYGLARERLLQVGRVLAERLGEAIQGSGFELRALIWDGAQWIAMPKKSSLRPVAVSQSLGERMAGWGTKQAYEEAASLFTGKWASDVLQEESKGNEAVA